MFAVMVGYLANEFPRWTLAVLLRQFMTFRRVASIAQRTTIIDLFRLRDGSNGSFLIFGCIGFYCHSSHSFVM
jgi:hypothetical protein